jgi:hypothetical protein
MPLHFVEFGIQFWQRRHAENRSAARFQQAAKFLRGMPVIVDVLDNIEGQYAVVRGRITGQTLRQIRFDELAVGAIQPLEHIPRDVQTGNSVTGCFERFQIDAPAAACLENRGGRQYSQLFQER